MANGKTYNIGFPDADSGEEIPAIEQGSTYNLAFTVTNIFAAGGVGATIRGQFRTSYEATEAFDFSCSIQSITPATETEDSFLTCLAVLPASVAASIPIPAKKTEITGVYDVEIEDVSGFVFKPLRGQAKVLAEATKL